jgi:hypothetical protein
VVDAIKQAMGSFVSFTFSTKFLCGGNQILTVSAVILIQSLRQAFMSKSRDLMSRNVNIRGDQKALFKLVMLNFIFKWYNWSNFLLLTASH